MVVRPKRAIRQGAAGSRPAVYLSYPRFDVSHVELIICELKQRPSAPREGEENTKYSYSANANRITHLSKDEVGGAGATVGYCDFTATAAAKDETMAEVTASYLFVFSQPEAEGDAEFEADNVTEFVVALSVWPRFRDLVAHMMAQGSTVFPPLPMRPDKLALGQQD